MSTDGRNKYTYTHPVKEGVELEVIATEERVQGEYTYFRRLDGIIVDIPTANIINKEVLS